MVIINCERLAGRYAARDNVSSAFPSLVPASKQKLGYLAFSGDMTGSNYKYGTLGGPGNTSKAPEKASGSAAAAKGPHNCRITAKNTTVSKSEAGYSAWTATSPGSGSYTKHAGDFCDCGGDGTPREPFNYTPIGGGAVRFRSAPPRVRCTPHGACVWCLTA